MRSGCALEQACRQQHKVASRVAQHPQALEGDRRPAHLGGTYRTELRDAQAQAKAVASAGHLSRSCAAAGYLPNVAGASLCAAATACLLVVDLHGMRWLRSNPEISVRMRAGMQIGSRLVGSCMSHAA
jgi:hypothetical protein